MPTPLHGNEISLGRRQLYMLPTRHGIVFGLLLVVLLLASVRYSNGLAYGLTFLLASMGIVSMLYTHFNVSRLRLEAGYAAPVFAGETAQFTVWLHNPHAVPRYGIELRHDGQMLARVDVPPHHQQRALLAVPARQRGYLNIPEFVVISDYPLGILYTWSRRVVLAQRCLVYPVPAGKAALPLGPEGAVAGDLGPQSDGDDFAGLREFHWGDAPQHISWKAAARGMGLHTKQFRGQRARAVWLDWERIADPDPERRLQQLCRWVLDAEDQGLRYGLRIPGRRIALNRGTAHRHACLEALALFPGGG